jgi:hypothetical protein
MLWAAHKNVIFAIENVNLNLILSDKDKVIKKAHIVIVID